ncbi:hypothetical protein Tco_0469164, partial [Tanacetum coccineum]
TWVLEPPPRWPSGQAPRAEAQTLISKRALGFEGRGIDNLDAGELQNPARAQELDQISEAHGDASSNPFITLSSGIGILTSGVLGAFYALAQKEKSANLATIESVSFQFSSLAAKESEFKKLSSIYEETLAELTGSKSEIEGLKQEILKLEKELESKSSRIDDLNAEILSLCGEKSAFIKELESLREEYAESKLVSEKQAESDAKLLEESGKKLDDIKEKLESTLTELDKNEVLVKELTDERDDLKKTLAFEVDKVNSLEEELQFIQKTLEDTRDQAADVTGRLEVSDNTCKNLETDISRLQTEYSEAKEALQNNIDRLRQTVEMLTVELGSTKDDYEKTKEELERVSVEIQEISENRDSLSKELVETYKKLENTIYELKEEKKSAVSLTKEVDSLKAEILEDKESRKSLETDLEEATKARSDVDESRGRLTISSHENGDLKKTNISNLKTKIKLFIIVKLGNERESLDKKGSKLEKELAAAKGEILRLRTSDVSLQTLKNALTRVEVKMKMQQLL